MKKIINDFDIATTILHGERNQLVICPTCKHRNFTNCCSKSTYTKIKTIICAECKSSIKIGDIFNFKTGTKLHKRNRRYNQQHIDNDIWNKNYSNI